MDEVSAGSHGLGMTDLFAFEPSSDEFGDGAEGYSVSDGTDWFRRLRERWPHPNGRAPYLRHDLGMVVADLAPLSPLVEVSDWEASVPLPEGYMRVQKSGPDHIVDDFGTAGEGEDG